MEQNVEKLQNQRKDNLGDEQKIDSESKEVKFSAEEVKNANVLRKVLTSEAFIEKVFLLLLTVVLSGLAIPYILSRLNASDSARQQMLAESKARQEAIIQAQSDLLNDFSEVVFTYETLALDVSWYGTSFAQNDELSEKAFTRYNEQIVELVSRWRILASRAQFLASPSISEEMLDFLNQKVFQEQDKPIVRLYNQNASVEEWDRQHGENQRILEEANQLIASLATGLNLTETSLSR